MLGYSDPPPPYFLTLGLPVREGNRSESTESKAS